MGNTSYSPASLGDLLRQRESAALAVVFTDLVGSTRLKEELGDQDATARIESHQFLVRRLLGVTGGLEIKTAGDSFLAVFLNAADAVLFALRLQDALRREHASLRLAVRIGINSGDVLIRGGEGPLDVYGLHVDIAARLMSLGDGGQILCSRGVFEGARPALKGRVLKGLSPPAWRAHGPYVLRGVEDPVDLYEVGEEGAAPFRAPGPSAKAEPAAAEEEPGWRPAPEAKIPGTEWVLGEKLGEGGFGEAWRAQHRHSGETRVFKFCFHRDRLRSLRRELAIFRLLREEVGDHPGIVRLYEVKFDEPPYYLGMEHIAGRNLREWLRDGRLKTLPLGAKLEIAAQVADALGAAHQSGILHQDVKPENILVDEAAPLDPSGAPKVKLSDFGVGRVVHEEILARVRTSVGPATMLGPTQPGTETGTLIYMAPERLEGKPPSPASDLFALGAVLFQMVVGDVERAVTQDWEHEVADPLVREDLRRLLAGKPEARPTAAEAAGQLRAWSRRRRARTIARIVGAAAAVALACAVGFGVAKGWVLPPGWIQVESDPPGAEVWLDGRDTGRRTPARMTVWPPRRDTELSLRLEGRQTVVETITLPSLKTRRLHLALPSAWGRLSVRVEPANATVVARRPGGDEIARFAGSADNALLPVGPYLAEVTSAGHAQVMTAFEIAPDGLTQLPPIRLEHEFGYLTVESGTEGVTMLVYRESSEQGAALALPTLRPVAEGEIPPGRTPSMRVSLPAELVKIDTGSYRLFFVKENHFPRACGVTITRWSEHDLPPLTEPGGGAVSFAAVPGHARLRVMLAPVEFWTFPTSGAISSRATVDDLDFDGFPDAVFASADGSVYAVSGPTGRTLWSFETGAPAHSSPALADLDGDAIPDAVVGSDDRRVYALSGRDGRPLWDFQTGGFVRSSPALEDLDGDGCPDAVIGSNDRKVYALCGRDGHLLWAFETDGTVSSSPVLADLDGDGVPDAVVGSGDHNVYALSGRDGRPLWAFETENSVVSSPALADLDGDHVPDAVVGSHDSRVRALSGRDGRLLWSFKARGAILSSPALADLDLDGTPDCVVGSWDHTVYALSGRDGRLLWSFKAAASVSSSPAVADVDGDSIPDVVVGCDGNRVVALAGRDGRLLWDFETQGWAYAAPALADLDADGRLDVLIGSWDSKLYALFGQDAGPLWWYRTPAFIAGSPALADLDGDLVPDAVAGSWDSEVRALCGRDGRPLWSFRARDTISSSPALGDLDGDGVADCVIGSDDHWIYALSGSGGRRLWGFETGGPVSSSPALGDLDGDGVPDVVAGSDDHTVYALAGRDGRLLWSFETQDWVRSEPALGDLDGDRVPDCVIGSNDGNVYALSGRDGRSLWTFATGGPVATSGDLADLDGDRALDVFAGSVDGRVYALSGRDGRPLWSFAAGAPFAPPAAVGDLDGDGRADCVAGSADHTAYALSGRDGRLLWTFVTGGELRERPAAADQDGDGVPDVLLGAGDNRVYALSGRDGRLLWSFQTGSWIDSSPAAADLNGDGTPDVVAASMDGRVYALAGGAPPPGSPLWEARRLARHGAWQAILGMARGEDPLLGIPVGRALFALGRRAEARDPLARAAEAFPRNVEAHVLLAAVTEDPEPLRQALLLDPLETYDLAPSTLRPLAADLDLPEGTLARAVALLLADRAAEARAALDALVVRPGNAAFLRLRGRAALEAGDPEAALADWKELRRIGASFPRLEAWIAEAEVRRERARAAARDTLRRAGDLLRERRLDDAFVLYEAALAEAPGDAWTLNACAWALATAECADETTPGAAPPARGARAVELAERAATLAERFAPGDRAMILDTLAAAYWVAGRREEAVRTAERAVGLCLPGDEDLPAMRARLEAYRAGVGTR